MGAAVSENLALRTQGHADAKAPAACSLRDGFTEDQSLRDQAVRIRLVVWLTPVR